MVFYFDYTAKNVPKGKQIKQIEFRARRMHFPPGVPKLFGYVVSPKDEGEDGGLSTKKEKVNGAALDIYQENALARAVSESIERCCFINFEKEKIYSSGDERKAYIDPTAFILYSRSQYRRNGFPYVDPSQVSKWVKAESLVDGSIKYLPAELAVPVDDIQKIDVCTSTGAAAAKNEIQSLENGLCEVIERDALMCSWLLKSRWFMLEFAQLLLFTNIAELVAITQRAGMNIEVYFVVNDMDMITVVSRLYSADDLFNAFGSSCKLDIKLAIQRSIEESVMILRTQKILFEKKYVCSKRIKTLRDHVMIPYNKYYKDYRNWFLGKAAIISFNRYKRICENNPKTFTECINRLSNKGYEPLRVNILHTLLSDSGYYANKVIVPGMHPLEIDYDTRHVDNRRLMKYSGKNVLSSEVNSLPHPFG